MRVKAFSSVDLPQPLAPMMVVASQRKGFLKLFFDYKQHQCGLLLSPTQVFLLSSPHSLVTNDNLIKKVGD